MANLLKVDRSLLRHFPAPGVWLRIDPQVQQEIASLREVCARVKGVERLSYLIGAEYTSSGHDLKRAEVFLRAALSEFVSMEEAAVWDFKSLEISDPPKIQMLADPRLHVVRLLRHANVHLSASQLAVDHKPAVWQGPNGPQEFEYRIFFVTDANETVRLTNGIARYADLDLDAMLAWLATEQMEWGIQNVVLGAAESYARELAKKLPIS